MLGKLVCGSSSSSCTADVSLQHISEAIDHFGAKAVGYLNGSFDDDARSFGAFCMRVVLENSCAALVGRLDTFRLLYLVHFQSQQGFEYGKTSKSAFRWTGDVLSHDTSSERLWDSDKDFSKISRALFSSHIDHIYWRSAAESALDYLADSGRASEFADLASIDPTSFVSSSKGWLSRSYSTLSKGVHWEFFTSAIVMDEGTLKDTIRDCLIQISRIAYVSHFIPTAFRSMTSALAIDEYSNFRESFQ